MSKNTWNLIRCEKIVFHFVTAIKITEYSAYSIIQSFQNNFEHKHVLTRFGSCCERSMLR